MLSNLKANLSNFTSLKEFLCKIVVTNGCLTNFRITNFRRSVGETPKTRRAPGPRVVLLGFLLAARKFLLSGTRI